MHTYKFPIHIYNTTVGRRGRDHMVVGFKTTYTRRVWRYQIGSQNPYIEEQQTTQWPKENVQKDIQRSTKHTYKTKDWVTRTTLKTSAAYHHWCFEFESRSGGGVQHYVLKFVSDLRRVSGFLRVLWFPTHGILTPLPMVFWSPVPMVYRTPYPCYYDGAKVYEVRRK